MHNRNLSTLRKQLLLGGVSPRHVRRLIRELDDHIDDLQTEAVELGMSAGEARTIALQRIGDQDVLAAQISGQEEFQSWLHRHPRVARVYVPLAYGMALPAVPVGVGDGKAAARAIIVARWGTCLILGALATYALLYIMQFSLTLS